MIVQDAYVYVNVGLSLRLLRSVSSGDNAKTYKQTMADLNRKLEEAGFEVSLNFTLASSFEDMVEKLNAVNEDENIDTKLAEKIAECMAAMEAVVFAEAITKKVHVIPSRRFNMAYLHSSPEKLLKDGSFEKLDEIARSDFTSACRCILFGEATAAAFHILRATESALKTYYYHHRRQKRLPKPMWAAMVQQLKAKTKNRPPAALLTSLDVIREAYRNPTQHPQALYEIDAAQDLFGVCIDVIGKMASEL